MRAIRMRVCLHEICHAVAGLAIGNPVTCISIWKHDKDTIKGRCEFPTHHGWPLIIIAPYCLLGRFGVLIEYDMIEAQKAPGWWIYAKKPLWDEFHLPSMWKAMKWWWRRPYIPGDEIRAWYDATQPSIRLGVGSQP